MALADRLRELRTAAGLTQSALAAAAGLSVHAVRDIEQGRREPLASNLFRLADALRVSADDFRDPKPPKE